MRAPTLLAVLTWSAALPLAAQNDDCAVFTAAGMVVPDPAYDGAGGEVPSSEEPYAPVPLLEGTAGRDQELSTDFEDYDTTSGTFFAGLGLRLGW